MPIRMTTRRWMMAAVAVIALIPAAGLCWKWRSEFLYVAYLHERAASLWEVRGQKYDPVYGFLIFNETCFEADGAVKPQPARSFRKRSEHHAAMGRKYHYAAALPWLPVEDDPPEP